MRKRYLWTLISCHTEYITLYSSHYRKLQLLPGSTLPSLYNWGEHGYFRRTRLKWDEETIILHLNINCLPCCLEGHCNHCADGGWGVGVWNGHFRRPRLNQDGETIMLHLNVDRRPCRWGVHGLRETIYMSLPRSGAPNRATTHGQRERIYTGTTNRWFKRADIFVQLWSK